MTFSKSNAPLLVVRPVQSLRLILLFGLLTACQSTDGTQPPTPAQPMTVTGIARAIDGRLSINTKVILEQPDKTTLTAITDATGTFKLENIKAPYNLTIFSSGHNDQSQPKT